MRLGIFRYYGSKINILLLWTSLSEVSTLIGYPEWDWFPLFCQQEHQPAPLPSQTCPGLGNVVWIPWLGGTEDWASMEGSSGKLWETVGGDLRGRTPVDVGGVVVGGALSLGFIPQTPQQQGCRGGGEHFDFWDVVINVVKKRVQNQMSFFNYYFIYYYYF